MIGIPYNPAVTIFLLSQSLNASQFNPNVPDTGNLTTHNLLFDTASQTLIWVDTKTNLIVQETSAGSGGTIGGGGTLNYISKFSPDGLNVANSLLYDNGTSVGLGTITPDASAILELSSTTQGFATPRMTTLQRDAIVTPVIGLLIYNTSSSFFNYWDGLAWIQMDTSTGGDVSGSGTTNYSTMWTDGANSVIGNGTWYFSGNDYLPVTTGSNIGDDTHRIGTVFMASVFDYANNLTFYNGTSTTATLTTSGNFGVGVTPTATIHAKGIDNTSGNYALKVDNSASSPLLYARNDGNIGIGTSSPNYKLEVVGASNSIIQMVTDLSINVATAILSGKGMFGTSSNHDLSLLTNGSERITILNNGNVGIGNTSATSKLHVVGINSTSSNYALKVDNSASSPLLYVRNDGNVGINYLGGSISGTKLYINGGSTVLNTYAVRVDGDFSDILNLKNNGNVGIAVNNPNYKLNVFGDVGLEGINTGSFFNFGSNQNTYIRAGKTDQDIYLQDNHNGLVGVGTTSVSAKLQVKGIDSTSANYALKVDNSASSPLLYVRNDGQVEMNGFTIRQLSSYTIFKTSGANGYLFNNSADNTNLARLTDSGVLIVNSVATLNSNVGLSVKAQGVANATKEYIAELYKGTTNNTGITIASKEGVAYIQGSTTANGQPVNLVLGSYDGAGNQLENLTLKSSGVINIANMPTSNGGLVAGDLWNNAGVVNIV